MSGAWVPQSIRTRFAPSPTGSLHLGGLRTALYSWLWARKHGSDGAFVVRIEDTDQARAVAGAEENIKAGLSWAGLYPDEAPWLPYPPLGPYKQSLRLPMYQEASEKLLESGAAYKCWCSPQRLAGLRGIGYDGRCRTLGAPERQALTAANAPFVVRMAMPHTGDGLKVKDAVWGDLEWAPGSTVDPVLLKSDKWPTYHLACVVDDSAMAISHVIRGEEWLPSLPIHLALSDALKQERPTYAHLPLLIDAATKSKLSKRSGDASLEKYTANYTPEAVLNFAALLGWNPGGEKEVFGTMEELVDAFSLDGINKTRPVVAAKRMAWMGSQHFRLAVDTGGPSKAALIGNVQRAVLEEAEKRGAGAEVVDKADDLGYIDSVVSLMKDRLHGPGEAATLGWYFWASTYDQELLEAARKALEAEPGKDVLGAHAAALSELEEGEWTREGLDAVIKGVVTSSGLKTRAALIPLRVSVTGTSVGASLAGTLELLGRSKTLDRIQAALDPSTVPAPESRHGSGEDNEGSAFPFS